MGLAHPLHRQFFISGKAGGVALPASGLARDLLIQQVLDPQVRSIGLIRLDRDNEPLDAFAVDRSDGPYLLDFGPNGSPQHADFPAIAAALGHRVIHVGADEIVGEPRFATARTLWSYRFETVPPSMRLAIMSYLDDQGPLTLDDLCCAVPGPRDPVSVVMALLCVGDVELTDPLRELGPQTRLRSRA